MQRNEKSIFHESNKIEINENSGCLSLLYWGDENKPRVKLILETLQSSGDFQPQLKHVFTEAYLERVNMDDKTHVHVKFQKYENDGDLLQFKMSLCLLIKNKVQICSGIPDHWQIENFMSQIKQYNNFDTNLETDNVISINDLDWANDIFKKTDVKQSVSVALTRISFPEIKQIEEIKTISAEKEIKAEIKQETVDLALSQMVVDMENMCINYKKDKNFFRPYNTNAGLADKFIKVLNDLKAVAARMYSDNYFDTIKCLSISLHQILKKIDSDKFKRHLEAFYENHPEITSDSLSLLAINYYDQIEYVKEYLGAKEIVRYDRELSPMQPFMDRYSVLTNKPVSQPVQEDLYEEYKDYVMVNKW